MIPTTTRATFRAIAVAGALGSAAAAGAGVLPGDQTLIDAPGSYVLTADRFAPIQIAASDVELDCGGRGIYAGPLPIDAPVKACNSGEHGILISTPGFWTNNVTIRRCVIHGWDAAIYGAFVSGLLIDQTMAAHSWDGFDLNWASGIEIRNSKALHNGGNCGGVVNGDGIDLDLVDNALIWRNTVDGNLDHGVTLGNRSQGCGAPWRNVAVTFTRNGITNNGRHGFNVNTTKDSAFRSNKVDKNRGKGFDWDECNENNTACGNTGCNRDGCLSQPACQ